MTEPALPVVHGTTLTLNCDTDYTNLGGNAATCLYGQVVSTNGAPNCKSEFDILGYGKERVLSRWPSSALKFRGGG